MGVLLTGAVLYPPCILRLAPWIPDLRTLEADLHGDSGQVESFIFRGALRTAPSAEIRVNQLLYMPGVPLKSHTSFP